MQPRNTSRQLTAESFTPRNGDCWTMSWQKSPALHRAQHLPRLRRRHRRPRLDQRPRHRHRRWQHRDLKHSPQEEYRRSRILIPPASACSAHPAAKPCEGELPEVFPFLGSTRLEEPINRLRVTAVFHAHAHNGRCKESRLRAFPVYNVSAPLLGRPEKATASSKSEMQA